MITDHGEAEVGMGIIGSGGTEVCFVYLLSLLLPALLSSILEMAGWLH
jgi:hypothetical protein